MVTPPTINWLLNSSKLYFKDILGVVCKHKRYGTLLYRKGGDLQNALFRSLGLLKEANKRNVDIPTISVTSKSLMCLNSLLAALDADPDFAQVSQQKRAQIVQSVV